MPSPTQTIFAGEVVLAQFLDGTSLNVRVRQMPMRHLLDKVLPALADGPKLLSVVCESVPGGAQLPEDWIDNLTDESFNDLWKKARELNFSRAVKLAEESLEVATQLQPLKQKTNPLRSS